MNNTRLSTSGSPVLSIVLPAHNEAATIRETVLDYYNEIATKLPSALIVAEDGSADQTPQILRSLANEIPISLLSFKERKGFAKGVSDALKNCEGEWIFFSDSDGQYFPIDFWRLWENRLEYDMVIGWKTHRSDTAYRIVLSRFFHTLVNMLFRLSFRDFDCGFRLMRRDVVDSIIDETNILKYSFWTEFTVRASLKGFKIFETPIRHSSRKNGSTRIYKPRKLPLLVFNQLKGLVTLSRVTRSIQIKRQQNT